MIPLFLFIVVVIHFIKHKLSIMNLVIPQGLQMQANQHNLRKCFGS